MKATIKPLTCFSYINVKFVSQSGVIITQIEFIKKPIRLCIFTFKKEDLIDVLIVILLLSKLQVYFISDQLGIYQNSFMFSTPNLELQKPSNKL